MAPLLILVDIGLTSVECILWHIQHVTKKEGLKSRELFTIIFPNDNQLSEVLIYILFTGRKAEKKKLKNQHVQELTDKQRNPKAFTFNSAVKAERRFRRLFIFF